MDKLSLEAAAGVYSGTAHDAKPHPMHIERNMAFKAGAEWQRNHVWHKPCDIAEPGRDCLVEYMDGHGNVCIRIDRRTEYEWVNASHYDKILRWAYIGDISPASFDEILDENKYVLQRLKQR